MAQQRLQTLHLLIIFSLTAVIGACQKAAPEREEEVPTANLAELDRELALMYRRLSEEIDGLPLEFPDAFEEKLEAVLQNPETFNCSFDSLVAAGIKMTVSDDGRMRICHWFYPWSGQNWRIPAIVQARTNAGRIVVQNMRGE